MPERTPPQAPEPRYRIVCYELDQDGRQTVLLDTTAAGYIAAAATITDDGTMHGELATGGRPALRDRIAQLIQREHRHTTRSAFRRR
ncbi:MAG: hypothetical protein ACRDKL_03515 [Solirubrobacteraceae bacterium]